MATTLGKVDLEKLKLDVQVKFDKIREALNVREKLLLRQIDVILTSRQHKSASASASVSVLSSTNPRKSAPAGGNGTGNVTGPSPDYQEMQFITDNEENILNSIRSYGKFNLDNINLALQDLYINEDYIAPGIDHDTMYKCLSNNSSDASNGNNDEESIVVDFSTNKKLIRDNVSCMNESIINITLNEAKELIRKSNKLSGTATSIATETDAPIMPLNLEGILDEDEFDVDEDDGMPAPTHSKSSQTVENKRKSRFKPKITINNCNGTINLKNISNLTINCATEESFKATEVNSATTNKNGDLPKSTTVTTTTTSTSSAGSNHSNSSGNSASSSNAISPKQNVNNRHHVADDVEFNDDDRSATCEFYNRLLNEIKNSLKQKSPRIITDNQQRYSVAAVGVDNDNNDDGDDERQPVTSTTTTDDSNGNESSSLNTSQSVVAPNKKLVLRNFENLKIILEANDNSDVMRPVQIEQWLAEIISETEIEPMQNTDILEHSKIHGETC
ncbi:dentin sialophosphoprotein [Eupeodes corollae]|uniref:dentin sialophosphoprotein n=1 Tax=Eupeodes corollae TaxID=290404 RepID=UPI00249179E2|nr:dentin sialophosphoprotein [Eupeodes corollae]